MNVTASRTSTLLLLLLALGAAAFAPATAQQAPSPEAYADLEWRYIGPEGNRFSAAAGLPSDPYTYYVGAASGGIYKTTDGGVNWDAIFDDQPVQSIGALGVSLTDPNIVWAGTGEGKIRSHISIGQGIYKSTDAGATWTLMGLEQTGRIPRLAIHPTDPDIVYACALGHSYGPQQERGVYRTMDGGKAGSASSSWTRTPGARTSRSTRSTRATCSPGPGSSKSTPTAAPAADPAEACTSPATAAIPGRSSTVPTTESGFPTCRWGRSRWRSLPRTRSASTPCSRPATGFHGMGARPRTARSGVRPTAAAPGRASPATATPWGARTTTRGSWCRRTTRTRRTS